MKRPEVNSDRILDLFAKEKEKQKLITEQKIKLMDSVTNHYMGSICQKLMRKV